MRKRSAYRPRGVILDTMAWVRGGFRPLRSIGEQNVTLRLRNHTAFDGVLHGDATASDLDTLIAMSNMTTALSRKHGGDWRDEIRAAADALEQMQVRYCKWRKVQATATELDAVRLLLRVHDAQLDASTINDLDAALQIVRKADAVAA